MKEEMSRLLEATAVPMNEKLFPSKIALRQPEKIGTYPLLPPKPVKTNSPNPHPIEQHIVRKLARGRQSIDSRIDLHGFDPGQGAVSHCKNSCDKHRLWITRIVLVITGKGNDGAGVLRVNVPRWLDLPGFREMVNGLQYFSCFARW